ncbi:hypothetical protein QFZ82_000963 [Streptomyces sp. V4I23]|nr:hypothetical protein [Streptomyces sp. V4I23]
MRGIVTAVHHAARTFQHGARQEREAVPGGDQSDQPAHVGPLVPQRHGEPVVPAQGAQPVAPHRDLRGVDPPSVAEIDEPDAVTAGQRMPGGQRDGRRLLGDTRGRERSRLRQVQGIARCGHAVDQREIQLSGGGAPDGHGMARDPHGDLQPRLLAPHFGERPAQA